MFNFTNEEYDPSRAKEELQRICEAVPYPVVQEIPSRADITDKFSDCKWSFRSESNRLAVYRIIEHTKGEDGQWLPEEEVVFALRGVLANKELPPIVKTVRDVDKAAHLSQSVTISGLDSPGFSNLVDSFYCVQEHFQDLLGDSQCETWKPRIFESEEFLAITASNKYFSSGSLPSQCKILEFPKTVDPCNILQSFNGGTLKYSEDNVVGYWQSKKLAEGMNELKVDVINPAKIVPGQIVEIQASIIFVRGKKKGKYILLPILRGVNVLDDTILKSARERKSNRWSNNTPNNTFLACKAGVKRKVGYERVDVEMTTNKLQKNI